MRILRVLLIGVVLLATLTTSAEHDSPYQDEINRCRDVQTPFETDALCEEYIQCAMERCGDDRALVFLLDQLLLQCVADTGIDCLYDALLSATSLRLDTLRDFGGRGSLRYTAGFVMVDDPDTAENNLSAFMRSDVYLPEYLDYVALSIFDARRDDWQRVIEWTTESIALHYDNPYAFYLRSLAYSQTGQDDLAARDATIFQQQSNPITRQLPALAGAFSRDDMQVWHAYPVIREARSPGGDFYDDLSRSAPIIVQLQRLDDNTTIVLTDLQNANADVMFVPRTSNADQFMIDRGVQPFYGGLGGGGQMIQLRDEGDYVVYWIMNTGSESLSNQFGILLPQSAPDPRDSIPSRICPDAAYSLILVAQDLFAGANTNTVWSGREFQGLTVYRDPNYHGDAVAEDQRTVELVADADPVCADGAVWWQVTTNDNITGWIAETEERNPTRWQIRPDIASWTNAALITGLQDD